MEKALSLHDVADQLRIQRSYLQALETGDFDNLPGLTYAIGYVRSYSQLVGLNAEKMIIDFKAEAKKLQEPTQLSFPSPAPEGKVPGGALMFVGVLLAAVSYGGWYYFSTSDTTVSDLTPTIPDRLAFLLEEPAIASSEPAAAPATDSAATSVAAIPETTQPAKAASAEAPAERLQAAPVASKPATEPAPATTTATDSAETETSTEIASANELGIPERSDTREPAVADSPAETEPAAPEMARTGTEAPALATETASAVETIPAAEPSAAETAARPEPVATAPSAATAPRQVASVTAEVPSDIPAAPEVSRSASLSAVDAEAAAIDSKPAAAPAASSEGPRIVISATDDSWVQVRGEDATPLLTRILRKGEAYEVPVRSGLKLFTGNAGALKISIDGTEAPSLGPFGKIARNIPLDESLLSFTATD